MKVRLWNWLLGVAAIVAVGIALAYSVILFASGMQETQQPEEDAVPEIVVIEEEAPAPTEEQPTETEAAPPEEEPEDVQEEVPEEEPAEEPAEEPDVEVEPEPEPEPDVDPVPWTDADVEMLAKLMYAEAGGVHDTKQQAAIAWCVLNRLDEGSFGDTIAEVITAPEQFAWHESTQTTDAMRELAEDVLERWWAEKNGATDVGRVLPSCYLYFDGDGVTNHFHVDWQGQYSWGWTLPDPYSEDN